MLISKVGAEQYEQKKIIMAGQHMVLEPAEGIKNPGGKGASSNVVGIICPPPPWY